MSGRRPRLTLRGRAYLLLAFGLGAGAIVTSLALIQVRSLTVAQATAVSAERARADNEALMLALTNEQSDLRGYTNTAMANFATEMSRDRTAAARLATELREEANDPEERSLESDLSKSIVSWDSWAESRAATVADAGHPVNDPGAVLEGYRRFTAVQAADRSVAGHLDEDASTALAASDNAALASLLLVSGGAGLSALVLIVLGTTFFGSLLGPVSRLAGAARLMAAGEPVRIEGTKRNDEVGDLAQALLAWDDAARARLLAVERFQAVFRDSALGIALLDLEGRVRETNPAFDSMLKVPPGRPLREAILAPGAGWSQLPSVAEGKRRQLLLEGQAAIGETTLWVRVVVSALSPGGTPVGLVAMIENITEERHSLTRLEALNDIGAAVLKGDGADAALKVVASWARRLAQGRLAAIGVLTPDGAALQVMAADGEGASLLKRDLVPLEGSLSGEAVRRLRSVVSRDPLADRRAFGPTAEKAGPGPYAAVPLQRNGVALGAVMVWRAPDAAAFSAAEVRLLQAFAHQAAIALELGWSQERVRRLMVIAEKERIARDLQDQVSQSLFGISSLLEGILLLARDDRLAQQLESAIVQLQKSNRTVLDLVYGLHPALADAAPLDEAMRKLADELDDGDGRITMEVEKGAEVDLAPLRRELIEIVRELIEVVGGARSRLRLGFEQGSAVVELHCEDASPSRRRPLASLRQTTTALKGRLEAHQGRDGCWHLKVVLPGAF